MYWREWKKWRAAEVEEEKKKFRERPKKEMMEKKTYTKLRCEEDNEMNEEEGVN